MIHIIFIYLQLFYIALTESLFMQIFAILIFYIASKIAFAPGKNWYYPQDKIQNFEPNNVDVWSAFQERK